jgi:hypothetical protein
MKSDHKVTFTATIIQHEGKDAAYILFPFEVKDLYGVRGRVAVKAIFDDQVLYRGSLAKMKTPKHILIVTKEIRHQLGKTFGDQIKVQIEQDLELREIIVPDDVKPLLEKNPKARKFFESLSFTDRKEYIRWIETAQRAETRERRIGLFIEKLNAKKKFMD